MEVPEGHLKPGVDGRRMYVEWARGLAPLEHGTVIDIGTGPVAIHAQLLDNLTVYCTEIDQKSFENAYSLFKNRFHFHKVDKSNDLLDTLFESNTVKFDFCVCNPPFFDISQKTTKQTVMTDSEGFYPGGELAFCRLLIEQSRNHKDRLRYGTCLLGSKKSVSVLKRYCGELGAKQVVSEVFCPNKTRRWAIAWTFNRGVKLRGKEGLKPLFLAVTEYELVLDRLVKECDCVVSESCDERAYNVVMQSDKWTRRARRSGEPKKLRVSFTVSLSPWSDHYRMYFDCDPKDRDLINGLISFLKH